MANLKTKKTVSMQRKKGTAQQYSSPTFKAIAADHKAGKITTLQAINKIVPKGSPEKVRKMVAEALGIQIGKIISTQTQQKINEQFSKRRKQTKQTRKPSK
tara:strand:- start:519 stop:821 length:303 start_codon:yes stop_codon:yes gene_type:complete